MKLSLFKKEKSYFWIEIIFIYGLIFLMTKEYGGYLLDEKNDEVVNFYIASLFILGLILKIFKKEAISVGVDIFTILITILLTMRSTKESKETILNSVVIIECIFLPMFYVYISILSKGIKNSNSLSFFYEKNYRKDINENIDAINKNTTSYLSRPAFYIDKINKRLQINEEYAYSIEVEFDNREDQKKVYYARDVMARYFAERGYNFNINKLKETKGPDEPDKLIVVSWSEAEDEL